MNIKEIILFLREIKKITVLLWYFTKEEVKTKWKII